MTINELLKEGRAISERAAETELRRKENQAKEALRLWQKFVTNVYDDLGSELANTADPKLELGSMPASFVGTDLVRVTLRPFGAGAMVVSYAFGRHKDTSSIICKTGTACPEVIVEQGYSYNRSLGKVVHASDTRVYDLAEAVYLCSLQTDGYKDADLQATLAIALP